jgi:hypothetical protein
MSGTAHVPGQELEQQQQQNKLMKGAIVSASSSAATVWAGLTEVERTSLLVAFARWAHLSRLSVSVIFML